MPPTCEHGGGWESESVESEGHLLESASSTYPADRFFRESVERFHGQGDVLPTCVLDFVVADPVETLHEKHHGRDARHRHLRGIVKRTRG